MQPVKQYENDNERYYEAILTQIGSLFGDLAYANENGIKQENMIFSKLPGMIDEILCNIKKFEGVVEDNNRLREMLHNMVLAEQQHISKINELNDELKNLERSEHLICAKETSAHLGEISETLKNMFLSK